LSYFDLGMAAARLGYVEYRAANPWRVIVTAEWPRAILQCLFFTMLGSVIGGDEGGRFAFVGAVAVIVTLSTVGGISDIPGMEKWAGTFHHLRRSGVQPMAVFVPRTLPWAGQAMLSVLLCLAVVGPLTGNGDLSLALLPTLPVFLLMAFTTAAAGLAAASPALGRRADVLVSNALMYLIIATGGLLIPTGRVAALDIVGQVMPMRHGVTAIRSYLDGDPYLGSVGLELLVGTGWALLAILLYHRQAIRARTDGIDDFA
jgi:ABC-2 type transport system permease protein